MLTLTVLFAADPWFQDFGFWALFLGAIGGSIPLTWSLARIYYRRRVEHSNEERERLARELRDAIVELKKAKSTDGRKRVDLERQLVDAQDDTTQLQKNLAQSQEGTDRLLKVIDGLNRNLRIAHQ